MENASKDLEPLSKVTAVLITKLPEYPKDIPIEGFGEVIVRTNCPNIYERYVQASRAKNEIIYVQDDDCTVDYRGLFAHYNGRITNAMTSRRKYYDDVSGGHITLVGWGTFFPKSMLSVFKQYIDKYGTDDEHLMREADRIFTWLNYPHNSINYPHVDLERFVDDNRMHADPNHFAYVEQVAKKLETIMPRKKSAGWKFWKKS